MVLLPNLRLGITREGLGGTFGVVSGGTFGWFLVELWGGFWGNFGVVSGETFRCFWENFVTVSGGTLGWFMAELSGGFWGNFRGGFWGNFGMASGGTLGLPCPLCLESAVTLQFVFAHFAYRGLYFAENVSRFV